MPNLSKGEDSPQEVSRIAYADSKKAFVGHWHGLIWTSSISLAETPNTQCMTIVDQSASSISSYHAKSRQPQQRTSLVCSYNYVTPFVVYHGPSRWAGIWCSYLIFGEHCLRASEPSYNCLVHSILRMKARQRYTISWLLMFSSCTIVTRNHTIKMGVLPLVHAILNNTQSSSIDWTPLWRSIWSSFLFSLDKNGIIIHRCKQNDQIHGKDHWLHQIASG